MLVRQSLKGCSNDKSKFQSNARSTHKKQYRQISTRRQVGYIEDWEYEATREALLLRVVNGCVRDLRIIIAIRSGRYTGNSVYLLLALVALLRIVDLVGVDVVNHSVLLMSNHATRDCGGCRGLRIGGGDSG